MLKKIKKNPVANTDGHFAIIASQYNDRYVGAMLRAALRVLRQAKVEGIRIVQVPGAFEIPAVAAKLARTHTPPLPAIICLGVILRGETTHAQHIGEAVSNALSQIQVRNEIPVIHEVLLLENTKQAEVRCLSKDHNRGAEAAQTALTMAKVMKKLG